MVTNKLRTAKGFSLIEVLAASFILLIVAGMVVQLSSYPKRKIIAYEKRMAVGDELNRYLTQFAETVPFSMVRQTSCSNQNSCDATICTAAVCDGMFVGGVCDGAPVDPLLDAIVQAYPTACYVSVLTDPTYDQDADSRATLVAVLAEWRGEQGVQHEALTTYVFAS